MKFNKYIKCFFCFVFYILIQSLFIFFFLNKSLLYKSFYLSKFFILHIVHPPDCDLSIIFCPDFQNYLRTQTGNNTTVNIIISTVDYLLRVQVSFFCSILLLMVELYSNDCNSHDGLKNNYTQVTVFRLSRHLLSGNVIGSILGKRTFFYLQTVLR